jgi:hypothetical protein
MKIECKDKDLMGKKVWEEDDDWGYYMEREREINK